MSTSLKERVADARDRLIEYPETARIWFSGSSRPAGGAGSEAGLGERRLRVAPLPGLGEGDGPNPAELILAAVAACQEMAYRAWAAALGIPLDDVRVEVEGEIDFRGLFAVCPNARPGFRRLRGAVHLASPAEPQALERLRRAVDEHCPALDMLNRSVPVSLALAVESRAGETRQERAA